MSTADGFDPNVLSVTIEAARACHELADTISPDEDEVNDADLIEQLAAKRSEYHRLFEDLTPTILSTAKAAVQARGGHNDPNHQDEVASATLEKVYQNLYRFEGNTAAFIAWVKQIARNCSVDLRRQESRIPSPAGDLYDRTAAKLRIEPQPKIDWSSDCYETPSKRKIEIPQLSKQVTAFFEQNVPRELCMRAVFVHSLGLWAGLSSRCQEQWVSTCSPWPLSPQIEGDAHYRLDHALDLLQESQLASAWSEEGAEWMDGQGLDEASIDLDWELDVLERTQNGLRQRISHALRRNLWVCLLASEIWKWTLRYIPPVADSSFDDGVPDLDQMRQILMFDAWVGLEGAEQWKQWLHAHGLQNSARLNFIDLFSVSPVEGNGQPNTRKLDKIHKWFRASASPVTVSASESRCEGLPEDAFHELLHAGAKYRNYVDIPIPFR